MRVIEELRRKLKKRWAFLRNDDVDEDYELLLVTPKDAVSRRNQSHQVTPVATDVFGIILDANIPTGPSEIFGMELEATEASCIYGTEIDEDASEQSADIIICEDEPNGNLLVFVEEEEPVQVNFLMCTDGD